MRRLIQYLALILATASLLTMVAFPGVCPFFQTARDHLDLSISPPSIDLGVVSQGAKVPFTFSVSNNTYHPITELSVQSSCGCTLVESVSNSTLTAYKSQLVSGSFDANHTRGRKATHMLVGWSTESGRAEQIVTVTANVTPVVSITPDSLEFCIKQSLDKKSVQTKRIELRSAGDIPFTIDDVRLPHPALEVKQRTDLLDDHHVGGAVLDIAFNPQYPNVAALTGSSFMEIRTNIASEPVLQIPIKIMSSIAGQK